MQKKMGLMLATAMLVASLTGCSASGAETKSPEVKQEVVAETPNEQEAVKEEVVVTEDTTFTSLITNETDTSVTYKDIDGSEITITKNPKKVVVLYNSYLDLWYLNGGEAVGRASGSTGVPEAALDVPELGKYSKPNMEEIMALEPDMIVLRSDYKSHRAIEDVLKENGVEICFVDYTTYEEFLQVNEIFAAITGEKSFFENDIKAMTKQINALKEKTASLPAPSTLILFATSKSLSCENAEGTTGHIVAELNGDNIIKEQLAEGETRVDFSLETIVERNPEIIVVKTMGDIDKAKGTLKDTAMSNEAWEAVQAVIDERVTYLPKDLFMYKPNARYLEAYVMMAELLFPEEDFSEFK